MSDRQILHVIHGLTVGGAEVDLVRKAAWMTSNGECDATVCCLMRRGALADAAGAAGIRVVGPLMRHRYDVGAAVRLDGVLRSRNWSLVHAHMFGGNLVTWLVRSLRPFGPRPSLIASEHADAARWNGGVRILQRGILGGARVLQVPSEATRRSYETAGFPTGRLRVVPNAVVLDSVASRDEARRRVRDELGVPDDRVIVGAVSRLQRIKGLEVLVDAVLSLDAFDVTLVIAGDGPERARLEERVRFAGASDRVRLLGTRHDVPDLLAAFDVFALHSHSESFAISVAEALLAGVPVVATDVGAIPEVTDGQRFARLVPPGDASAMAAAIAWTIEHRDEAAERARKGRIHVENRWSVEAAARCQLMIYDEVGAEVRR